MSHVKTIGREGYENSVNQYRRNGTRAYLKACLLSLTGRTEKTHVLVLCYLVYILNSNWTDALINQPFKFHVTSYAQMRRANITYCWSVQKHKGTERNTWTADVGISISK